MAGNFGTNRRKKKNETGEYYATERYRIGQKTESTTQRFSIVTRWIGFCFIAWCALQAIEAIAGQDTNFAMNVDFLAKMTFDRVLSWSGCGVLGYVYYRSKKVSSRRIKELADHAKELEEMIDSGRSSSKVRDDGTHPTE